MPHEGNSHAPRLREWNADADYSTRHEVFEVDAFAHFPAANAEEKRAIYAFHNSFLFSFFCFLFSLFSDTILIKEFTISRQSLVEFQSVSLF